MPVLLALVPLFAAAPSGSQDDGRGWHWSELDLELWIEPDLGKLHLEGSGRLVLAAEASSGPTLFMNGALLEFVGAGAPGAAVEVGLESLGFLGQDRKVAAARLRFAEPKARGAEVRVDFECQSSGHSAQFAVTPQASLASWTQAWYPVPDNGFLGWRAGLRAPPGRTRFHLPEGWRSLSNGERVADDGAHSETWRVTFPVARSFACAPYALAEREVNGRSLAIYRLASARGSSDAALRGVAECLRILESRFGPYPYPSWSVAEVPDGVGDFLGSSEQGFVMVRPVAFEALDGNLALFAHELAHGWWGNLVGSSGPGSPLLDEGLAQYSAVLAIEGIEGPEAATDFLRFSRPGYVEQQCARGYFEMWRAGLDQALATLTGGGWQHQLADAKGHWVYHMLRDRVGDEAFFATLRELLRDHRERPLTLDALRERFEEAAPDLDLALFFEQWLERTGAPILEHEWHSEGNQALVTVRQVQAGEPYSLALELALDSAAGRRIHTVALSEREACYALPLEAAAMDVVLDPRHRLLRWTDAYGPRPGQ